MARWVRVLGAQSWRSEFRSQNPHNKPNVLLITLGREPTGWPGTADFQFCWNNGSPRFREKPCLKEIDQESDRRDLTHSSSLHVHTVQAHTHTHTWLRDFLNQEVSSVPSPLSHCSFHISHFFKIHPQKLASRSKSPELSSHTPAISLEILFPFSFKSHGIWGKKDTRSVPHLWSNPNSPDHLEDL